MKVVAYGVRSSEKGFLARANKKKHDITLISNPLSSDTAFYAQGKEAVISFSNTLVAQSLLQLLASLSIRYFISHIEEIRLPAYYRAAMQFGLVCANVPIMTDLPELSGQEGMQQAARQTIWLLDAWPAYPAG